MFIETERTGDGMLHRAAPSALARGAPVWAAHMLIVGAPGQIQSETDRAKFLGRGNTRRIRRMLCAAR